MCEWDRCGVGKGGNMRVRRHASFAADMSSETGFLPTGELPINYASLQFYGEVHCTIVQKS